MDDDGVLRCVAQWHEDGTTSPSSSAPAASSMLRPGEGSRARHGRPERPVWLGDAIAAGHLQRDPRGRARRPSRRHGVRRHEPRRVHRRDRAVLARRSASATPSSTRSPRRSASRWASSSRRCGAQRRWGVSEARKRAVLARHSTPSSRWTTRADRGAQPGGRAAVRVPEETAVGREMAELVIPPELRDGHREGLGRYLETGESRILGRRIELSAVRAGGERVPGGAGGEPGHRLRAADVHGHDA